MKHWKIIVETIRTFTSFVGLLCLISSLMGIEHMINCVQTAAALLASLGLSLTLNERE